jgi:hypothetical protein
MKYMVQFQFKLDSKAEALETFERLGPNRYPGVAFRSAWISSNRGVAFVLVESAMEESVSKAAELWKGHGEFSIFPVIDIEQY